MAESTGEEKKPSDVLVLGIKEFTEDIECLYSTLPLIMVSVGLLHKESAKELNDFIKKNAASIEKKEDSTKFLLNIEDLKNFKAVEYKFDNFSNAIRLIPRNFVIALVSQYDSFLAKIVKFIFLVKPEILNSSNKSLLYTDLNKFETIQSALEYIIEKEIEAIIRKSHSEQFEWLSERLKTRFDSDLKCWPTFIELTERRNLFVHCDGKVSSQYLNICSKYKCDIAPSLQVGDELKVSKAYFEYAYRCIYEIGVKLAHVIWRRLCPSEIGDNDESINNIAYNLIDKGQCALAIDLLDFFTGQRVKHADEESRLVLVVNKAQAYKWAGDNTRCNEILDSEDWSACHDNFKLVVAVLKEDYERAYEYMRRLKNDERFRKVFYKDWPLFKKIRQEGKFKEVYRECYSEDLKIEQEKPSIDEG